MKVSLISQSLLSVTIAIPLVLYAGDKPATTDPAGTNKVQTTAASQQAYPRRGMTMKQVRKKHGEPRVVRQSKGRIKKDWPRITVWNYGGFSVYFERNITLHTVVH